MNPPPLCDQPIHHPPREAGERKTRRVMLLTLVTMVLEIGVGLFSGSMALLADGWHMGSHVLALGLAWGAYILARHLAGDSRFAFGTWKIEVLAGYTSALMLLGVAAAMAWESALRLLSPVAVRYDEALPVAILGLGVNLLSAYWLHGGQDHHHHHDHAHGDCDHGHHHHDLNLKAAYLHVMADAATSVMAIVALLAGRYWQVGWMDPVMGLVGAVLVATWAWGLLRETGAALLDMGRPEAILAEIREVLASLEDAPVVSDLHLWRVGHGHYACIIGFEQASPATLAQARERLSVVHEVVHLSLASR